MIRYDLPLLLLHVSLHFWMFLVQKSWLPKFHTKTRIPGSNPHATEAKKSLIRSIYAPHTTLSNK